MLKKLKKRIISTCLVAFMVIGLIPSNVAYAAYTPDATSGLGVCYGDSIPVYSNSSLTSKKGSIFDEESFTVLRKATNSSGVEYFEVSYANSTSSGGTGYVRASQVFDYYHTKTAAGMVNYSSTVYYGTDTSRYGSSGSVSTGEYVCVLAAKTGWYYIEYNTSSGRKRAWCPSGAISTNTSKNKFTSIPEDNEYIGYDENISGSYTVYAGPGRNYAQIGQVGNENVYYIFEYTYGFDIWRSVSYSTSSSDKLKVGWIFYDFRVLG